MLARKVGKVGAAVELFEDIDSRFLGFHQNVAGAHLLGPFDIADGLFVDPGNFFIRDLFGDLAFQIGLLDRRRFEPADLVLDRLVVVQVLGPSGDLHQVVGDQLLDQLGIERVDGDLLVLLRQPVESGGYVGLANFMTVDGGDEGVVAGRFVLRQQRGRRCRQNAGCDGDRQ